MWTLTRGERHRHVHKVAFVKTPATHHVSGDRPEQPQRITTTGGQGQTGRLGPRDHLPLRPHGGAQGCTSPTLTAGCWPLKYPGSILSSVHSAGSDCIVPKPLKGKREVKISLIKGGAAHRKGNSGMLPSLSPASFQGTGFGDGEWKWQFCHSAVSSQGQPCTRKKESLVLHSAVRAPEKRWRLRKVNFIHSVMAHRIS